MINQSKISKILSSQLPGLPLLFKCSIAGVDKAVQ